MIVVELQPQLEPATVGAKSRESWAGNGAWILRAAGFCGYTKRT